MQLAAIGRRWQASNPGLTESHKPRDRRPLGSRPNHLFLMTAAHSLVMSPQLPRGQVIST